MPVAEIDQHLIPQQGGGGSLIGGLLGSTAGKMLGTAIAGPLGGAIGGQIGKQVGGTGRVTSAAPIAEAGIASEPGQAAVDKGTDWLKDRFPLPFFNMGGQIPYYNQGGPMIKPGNKGKFTAKANAAGEGVQEYARKVLSAPEGRYDPATRKQANFARNAAAWHKNDGGLIGPLAKTTHTTKDGDKYEMNFHNPLMVGQSKSKEE